jgi:hypothetical protein
MQANEVAEGALEQPAAAPGGLEQASNAEQDPIALERRCGKSAVLPAWCRP